MKNELLNGQELFRLFKSGVEEIERNKDLLNKINVYPVADGDTGSNLLYTLKSAITFSNSSDSASEILKSISEQAIIFARGNSGIIFSEFIHGLSFYSVSEQLTVLEFIELVNRSSIRLYEVVKNPIEGTILTVIRKWSAYLKAIKVESFNDLFELSLPIIKKGVDETTKELKDLQKYKVPDSGAMGFYLFMEGFSKSINGDDKEYYSDWKQFESLEIVEDFIDEKYRYCTQFYVKDIRCELSQLVKELEIFGDSIAYSGDEKYLNIHLHTDVPWKVSNVFYKYGTIVNSKVDDMSMQNKHRDKKQRIGILTDSIADISQDIIDQYDIGMLPINLMVNQNVFLDKKTIKIEEFLNYAQDSIEFPSSSQPNDQQIQYELGHYLDYYDQLLIITVSNHLSGTYLGFERYLDNNPELKKRIVLIDSLLNSGGQGLFVKKVAEIVQNENRLEDVLDEILSIRSKIKIYVALNNFENLSKSGRVNKKIATFANKLNMKAILSLDQNGKGKVFGFSLSRKYTEKRILEKIKEALSKGIIDEYVLFYTNESEDFTAFKNKVSLLIKKEPLYCVPISSATALHVGRDSIAIAYVGEL